MAQPPPLRPLALRSGAWQRVSLLCKKEKKKAKASCNTLQRLHRNYLTWVRRVPNLSPLSHPYVFPPVPLSHLFPFTSKGKQHLSFPIRAVGFLYESELFEGAQVGGHSRPSRGMWFPWLSAGKGGGTARQPLELGRHGRGTASPSPQGLSRFLSVFQGPDPWISSGREGGSSGYRDPLVGSLCFKVLSDKAYLSIYIKNSRVTWQQGSKCY